MRALAFFVAITGIAAACVCVPEASAPLCQRIGQVQVAFVGTAIARVESHNGFSTGGLWYQFRVEEAFKGIDPSLKDVVVGPGDHIGFGPGVLTPVQCATRFVPGTRYLVLSTNGLSDGPQGDRRGMWRLGPIVTAGECSGSRPVGYAADDIAFIRQYLTSIRSATIFGFVQVHGDEYRREVYPPMPGVLVRARGPVGIRSTSTGQDGGFEFTDVEPGSYAIMATFPGFNSGRSFYFAEVPKGGCRCLNIGMFSYGSIAGTVLKPGGIPAAGVEVEYAYHTLRPANPPEMPWKVRTDAQGEFRFTGVPPGDFVVGVRILSAPEPSEGIPPTYLPGVTDRTKAQLVHLEANEQKEDLVIRLGPPVDTLNAKVKVQWPDGRPAAGATVEARVNGWLAEYRKTDSSGLALLPVSESVEYSFRARLETKFRIVAGTPVAENWVDAEPHTVLIGSSPSEIVLVLNRNRPDL